MLLLARRKNVIKVITNATSDTAKFAPMKKRERSKPGAQGAHQPIGPLLELDNASLGRQKVNVKKEINVNGPALTRKN